ncbi:MAG: iron ABC transporter permease [Synechococcales bacterium]|nr:iron ABC transporter permease [Synechococcales bacterium]
MLVGLVSRGMLRRENGWIIIAIAIALLVSSPVLVILSSVFADTGTVWQHLVSTVLKGYVDHSLLLMLGVAIGTSLIGISTAWLVTLCRFPGVRWLSWAMLLPMAAPAYILAYTYTELLEYYGPVQTLLRDWNGWMSAEDYWFPPIRSLFGAILMLTLVLYPYVFLLARSAFLNQSIVTLEASRSLGCNPWASFFKVALPMARPAIMSGLALALMEALNDFGTVDYFAVPTFTTGIYRTWLNMGERLAACQLAGCLLGFVVVLIVVERWSRGQAKYYQTAHRVHQQPRYELIGWRSIAACTTCFLPLLFGFLIPAGVLLQMAWENWQVTFNGDFWAWGWNSFTLAGLTALIATGLAVILSYGLRLKPTWGVRSATQLASMGYAIPGSVIAVGILFPIGSLDNAIDAWSRATFNISTGLLLSGTIAATIFAYLVRFLAVSFNAVDSNLVKIKPSLDDAARSLGHGTTSTLLRIHLPLLRSGLLTAMTLVFVDVMKELPATVIVRPFNFDTLAVRVYNLASDERLAEAAGAALAIVGVGLIPVILLSWQMSHRPAE